MERQPVVSYFWEHTLILQLGHSAHADRLVMLRRFHGRDQPVGVKCDTPQTNELDTTKLLLGFAAASDFEERSGEDAKLPLHHPLDGGWRSNSWNGRPQIHGIDEGESK